MDTESNIIRVPRDKLAGFTRKVLEASGLSAQHAIIVAASLLDGDARGLPSHGVVRLLPVYAERLLKKSMNPSPDVKVISRNGAALRIDGDGGPGQLAARFAMEEAIRVARELGVCVALVWNSSHYGIGSGYVELATQQGQVGIALTNAPSNMPPAGGKSKYFGTNPITVGVPYRDGFPVILDMSTSVVARGKIVIAQGEGQSIPDGWAIDAEGHPTNDPELALTGAVLPMAGYKGAGLALMIDVLSGVLSGAAYGSHIVDLYSTGTEHQNVGHFLLALNVEHFMPLADFISRMEEFVGEVRSQPRIPGVERIFMPGEIEYETALESAKLGIRMTSSGLSDLAGLARMVGVEPLVVAPS